SLLIFSFSFHGSLPHPHLHSFPTRRSSDLSLASHSLVPIRSKREKSPTVYLFRGRNLPCHPQQTFKRVATDARQPDKDDWIILVDRKSTRLNPSHLGISYAVFCLKKKKI